MKNNLILFLIILTLFISCKGQKTIGKSVNELGKPLWYIFQDTKNNYWFGSNGEGVYRYDGKTIVNFTTKDGLANDTVRQIQEDKFGNIFISTFGGINKFDGKTFAILQPIKSKEWKLETNDLWFYILGKKNEGVYRYDGQKLQNLEFPKHYLHDKIYPRVVNSFFSPYEVYSIYKDRKGAIWFGTSVFGACRFDGETVKWMYEDDLTYVPEHLVFVPFLRTKKAVFGFATHGTDIFSTWKKLKLAIDFSIRKLVELETRKYLVAMNIFIFPTF